MFSTVEGMAENFTGSPCALPVQFPGNSGRRSPGRLRRVPEARRPLRGRAAARRALCGRRCCCRRRAGARRARGATTGDGAPGGVPGDAPAARRVRPGGAPAQTIIAHCLLPYLPHTFMSTPGQRACQDCDHQPLAAMFTPVYLFYIPRPPSFHCFPISASERSSRVWPLV